ncbi:hypothetical protein FJT64_024303 [Amphibalanus amphitrite]|uniref:Uncharacterized protein n=1 Tax=Amphibalanus amphitrite TaxID=1232801 RepID=A0A6A4WB16_AMPAM|nr:hypothetical protein FJT64_024303 [Amphibalanus amphitrite]
MAPLSAALSRRWFPAPLGSQCPAMSAPPPPPPPPRLLGMNWEQPFACGRPGSWLAIDQACVAVANGGSSPLTLWAQSDQCHGEQRCRSKGAARMR